MGEVLRYEAARTPEDFDPARREDIEEVLNYRRAMREAVDLMAELPLCNRLIKKIHDTLLSATGERIGSLNERTRNMLFGR